MTCFLTSRRMPEPTRAAKPPNRNSRSSNPARAANREYPFRHVSTSPRQNPGGQAARPRIHASRGTSKNPFIYRQAFVIQHKVGKYSYRVAENQYLHRRKVSRKIDTILNNTRLIYYTIAISALLFGGQSLPATASPQT